MFGRANESAYWLLDEWQLKLPSNSFQGRWIRIISAIQINVIVFAHQQTGRWYGYHRRICQTKRLNVILQRFGYESVKKYRFKQISINLHMTIRNKELWSGFSNSFCMTILSASQRKFTPFSKRVAGNDSWLYVVNVLSIISSWKFRLLTKKKKKSDLKPIEFGSVRCHFRKSHAINKLIIIDIGLHATELLIIPLIQMLLNEINWIYLIS